MITPVILSGGSGTRLWPLSREMQPKQLLALNGERTMLQETALRLEGFMQGRGGGPVIVVCNSEHRFMAAEQLRSVGVSDPRIVLEPVGRNTAPALTLAALAASRTEAEDPILLVMPADHVVTDRDAFQSAVASGLPAATNGAIVTFGIVPVRPETGYGYIRIGVRRDDGALKLVAFVEKPNLDRAMEYVASGEYLWNSGLFMMRASIWLRALKALNPSMYDACADAYGAATEDVDFLRIESSSFVACPSDSIDYAVMEKLASQSALGIEGVVIPMSAGWSDVGAWDALWDVMEKDASGNAHFGETIAEGCEGSLLYGGGRLVAGVGLKDVIVVETADAVLVADKSRTQDVKKVVTRLKAEGRTLADSHRKIYRPWGWYDSIDCGDRFQVKRIVVNPGAKLSLQMHHHRAEHWIVVKGTAEVTNGEKVFLLSENESTYIPLGHVHRLANPGKVPLEIIEVQSGSYLGEDDIVRFEDTYGRAPNLPGT
ncbi:mannose-1-phosphate guanylyltransferase/mannose-6-phosphate isomerase [Aromatoleum evansii]|uniref:mannose-1-phosphate guanylyltransferase/mannose-6-phosphate isomerase n=1 Tax=Aromatoleum evansii TaxID=59406 RepID=UPI00145DED51|nr:mannose-1-phosphate guanylyltransferase/mannose-6-phosphate isomerase [Aromatoleum evansii]NMG29138.1 mannose-1-phosphate guanylyltransferase/mannose-6-phosphate isomerase [Aromatoleum evansii]